MADPAKPFGSESDATFLAWQKTMSGEIFPLYNVTVPNHPSYHSTVSDVGLRKLHLRTPHTPSPYPEAGPSPWHTLGIELNHPATARAAIEKAGLDYDVVKRRLWVNTEMERDSYATERTDTGDVLGIVGYSYQPIQNRDAFAFFDALVAEHGAILETAGVLGHGGRIWLLAKLPGHIRVNGNDIVNKYLLLANSHDGSSHVQVKVTPIRVVCNNTLACALRGTGDIQIPHTLNAMQDLEQAFHLLEVSESLYDQLEVTFNGMAKKRITEQQLLEYVKALVPDNEEGENNERTKRIRDSVLRLHESGRGARLSRGTLWGALNSVTEYTDHLMLDEDSTNRLHSIWFGRGELLKLKAFQLAERIMAE